MKAGVISGGGALGCVTVGRLKKRQPDYDIVVGCSTGSLIAGLTALGEWERLEEAYTSVTQKDIYNVNPFNKKGNLKLCNAAWRIITGKRTLGETENLLKLIYKWFTYKDYEKIRKLGKNVVVTVCNMSDYTSITEYKSIYDPGMTYDKFVHYIWASTCVPLICSIVTIDGIDYTDGGVTEVLPLLHVIEIGGKKIDCYLHRVEKVSGKRDEIKNVLHLAGRIVKLQRQEIETNDVLMGKQAINYNPEYDLNISYLPYMPIPNSMVFNKQDMIDMVNLGYELG